MIVVVNEANILIDLIKFQLVEAFFNINWEFHSTNLIIENELYDEQNYNYNPILKTANSLFKN